MFIDNDSMWDAGWTNDADDGSHGPLVLPFTFLHFGIPCDTAFINVNGNISFSAPSNQTSTDGLPQLGGMIVAPFWADVDLQPDGTDQNAVAYKVTEHALYVNWMRVGYYSYHDDKLNSFQLIISDGSDSSIPDGRNVSFCYRDMQWATGDFGGGNNGFNGTPGTAGANAGDSMQAVVIGRFELDSDEFDGPSGGPDGVHSLDSIRFAFQVGDTSQASTVDFLTYGCASGEIVGFPTLKDHVQQPFSLFPNPTLGIVTLQWGGSRRPELVQIMTGDGRTVVSFKPRTLEQRIELDFDLLAPGLYLVRVMTHDGVWTDQLVKAQR